MQIPRTLTALAVLLVAVAAWLLLVTPPAGVRYYPVQPFLLPRETETDAINAAGLARLGVKP